MVNTFLPWPDYTQTAIELDKKRLGKQRVEGLQILKANLGLTKGWTNHPAAVMWRGHEGSLCIYISNMCHVWTEYGYQDNIMEQMRELQKQVSSTTYDEPWWLGVDEFHLSHRSNLLRKFPEHYEYSVDPDLPYKWPMPDGSFRTIERKP